MTYGITNAGGGKSANLGLGSATSNGTYLASTDGLDGYSEFSVAVPAPSVVATNNSSYAREAGEKVWLYENNGSYSIVDNLGLTTKAFTGKCKEAIAIGASGEVEATTSGTIVTRWTRNFTAYNGSGAAVIDDTARTVTFNNTNQMLYKTLTSATPTPVSSVTIQYKSKFTGSGSAHNQSNPFQVFGTAVSTSLNSFGVTNRLLELINTKGLYFKIKSAIGDASTQERQLLAKANWVDGKWYWIKLEITDTTISGYWSEDGSTWSEPVTISGSGFLASFANKTSFGVRDSYDNSTRNGTVDANETWAKIDNDIIWQLYKPITE